MALVTMAATAAPGFAVLQALSVSHQGSRCKAAQRRILQAACDPRTWSVSGDANCMARGDSFRAMAQTPSAESVSMEKFSSVEELKAALLGSLEGAHFC